MIEGYSLQLKFDPIALSKAYFVHGKLSSLVQAQDFWDTYGVPEGVEVHMTLTELYGLDDDTPPKSADVKFSDPMQFFEMHNALWRILVPQDTEGTTS